MSLDFADTIDHFELSELELEVVKDVYLYPLSLREFERLIIAH